MFLLIDGNIYTKNFRKKYSHDLEKCNNQETRDYLLQAHKQAGVLGAYALPQISKM